jgi:hypothetical protein
MPYKGYFYLLLLTLRRCTCILYGMTDRDDRSGLRKEVIVRFILYFLAVVGVMFIARLISFSGYEYAGWFVGGALLALAMQMILVPKGQRRKEKILVAMLLTGIGGMLVNYILR